jgi:iron-sulfur cluster assembly accessory protein
MGCCGGGSCGTKETTSSGCGSTETVTLAAEGSPVTFTPAAIEAVRSAIAQEGEPGDGLRVSVVGGGCSGYQYNLDFDKEARMGDTTIATGGVNIYIDPISAGYLQGTVIDYVSGLQGTGFKFNNPNAKRSCGCGNSFS